MSIPAQLEVFETLTDVVVAFDADLTITYMNPFGRRLLEHESTTPAGQSLIDFLHPEDLGRAAEVASLISDDRLQTATTPAIYRVRKRTGQWLPIEINSTTQFQQGPLAGMIVIVARYNGDNELQDRILELLSSGEPIDNIVALVPGFGLWRHPEAQYAALYINDRGDPDRVGSAGALDLLDQFRGADTPWQRVLDEGRELLLGYTELPDDLRMAADELGMRGCMVLPVRDPLHDQLALVLGWSSKPDQDVGAHRYALERMARSLDILLQWRSHSAGLERAAQIDTLSGLVNRATFFRLFNSALIASRYSRQRVAVFYVDLDEFKKVNDSQGHAQGDAVITAAARRMTETMRRSDIVARIGGDEFAVLCHDITNVDEVTALADRLVATLNGPFDDLGLETRIGASVGIAISEPGELDHEALLAAADRALYEAKAAGKGRWLMAS